MNNKNLIKILLAATAGSLITITDNYMAEVLYIAALYVLSFGHGVSVATSTLSRSAGDK